MTKTLKHVNFHDGVENLGATTKSLVSTYVVCERPSVMHKQVSGWTVNFCPNFPESPFLEFQTRKPPPPPISENLRFEMTKVYSGIPPPFPGKLQIWDDQSLLRNTPPPHSENAWRLICTPRDTTRFLLCRNLEIPAYCLALVSMSDEVWIRAEYL